MKVTFRHLILQESIGTLALEDEAFFNVWMIFSATFACSIIVPFLLTSLFKWINTLHHPCHEIIKDEIKKNEK